MILGHWDNYGFNVNNYRIFHEPDVDLWYFTPGPQTSHLAGTCGVAPITANMDLAQRSQPWLSNEPMLVDSACKTELLDAMDEMITAFENMNLVSEIQRFKH